MKRDGKCIGSIICQVAPCIGGRGLKHDLSSHTNQPKSRSLHRGAWIETTYEKYDRDDPYSRSLHRGAWIETIDLSAYCSTFAVAPCIGGVD